MFSRVFGLAAGGGCHATRVATHAVGFYPTISPLPFDRSKGGLFSVALSVIDPSPDQRVVVNDRRVPSDFDSRRINSRIAVRTFLSDPERSKRSPTAQLEDDCNFEGNFDGNVVVDPNGVGSDSAHWVEFLAGTVFGDTNLDSIVNFTDLLVVAQNYDVVGPNLSWSVGNFNGDLTVNFTDLLVVAQHYGFGGLTSSQLESFSPSFQQDWTLALSMVPEPTSMLALATCTVFLRRRRA